MKRQDIKVGELYATGSSRNYGLDNRQQALVLALNYTKSGPYEGQSWQINDHTLVLQQKWRSIEVAPLEQARAVMTEQLYLDRREATKNFSAPVARLESWVQREGRKAALARFPKDLPGWELKPIPNREILQPWDEYVADRDRARIEREEAARRKADQDKINRKDAESIKARLAEYHIELGWRLQESKRTAQLTFEEIEVLLYHASRAAS